MDITEKKPQTAMMPAAPEYPEDKPRFEIINAAIALQPQPPIEFVIDNLITRGSVNVFYGEAGSKKTYALLYMAACCSVGKDFLRFTTKPRKVLFIDEESGSRRLLMRLGEVLRGALIENTQNIFYMTLNRLRLDNNKDVLELLNSIKTGGFDMVIIDALSDVMDGDENSKQDVQPVFNNLRLIADQTNAAIFIIHHPNKTGGYRGSSAIKGSVDLMIEVVSSDGSDIIKFSSKKERDIEKINFMAKTVWVDDQFYLQPLDLEDQIERMPDAQKFVIAALKGKQLFIKDILDMGNSDGQTEGTIRQAIKDLANLNTIYRTNDGGQGKPAQYAIREVKE